jgi:hypothetical protein
MNRNEKTATTNSGLNKNFNEHLNYSQSLSKTQLNLNFGSAPIITTTSGRKLTRLPFSLRRLVCDECCLPLHLYGRDFIESYIDEQAELLPSLCDLHLSELELEVKK